MDYGSPKVLPATGAAGFTALSLGEQAIYLFAIAVTVFATVTMLRVLWRRGKSVNQS